MCQTTVHRNEASSFTYLSSETNKCANIFSLPFAKKKHELLLNLQRKGEPEQPHIDQGQPQEHLGEGSTGVSAEINSPPSTSGFDLRAARNVFA